MYYSSSTNGFYSDDINGTDIPEGAIQITDEMWKQLLDGQSNGKMITSDKKGNPVLKDYPKPTLEQYIEIASSEKTRLLAFASNYIAPLQDAVDLDIATNEEITSLKAWKTYRVAINRVDISKAPDITWPKSPDA